MSLHPFDILILKEGLKKVEKSLVVEKATPQADLAHTASQHAGQVHDSDLTNQALLSSTEAHTRGNQAQDAEQDKDPAESRLKEESARHHLDAMGHHYRAGHSPISRIGFDAHDDANIAHRYAYSQVDPEGKQITERAHKASNAANEITRLLPIGQSPGLPGMLNRPTHAAANYADQYAYQATMGNRTSHDVANNHLYAHHEHQRLADYHHSMRLAGENDTGHAQAEYLHREAAMWHRHALNHHNDRRLNKKTFARLGLPEKSASRVVLKSPTKEGQLAADASAEADSHTPKGHAAKPHATHAVEAAIEANDILDSPHEQANRHLDAMKHHHDATWSKGRPDFVDRHIRARHTQAQAYAAHDPSGRILSQRATGASVDAFRATAATDSQSAEHHNQQAMYNAANAIAARDADVMDNAENRHYMAMQNHSDVANVHSRHMVEQGGVSPTLSDNATRHRKARDKHREASMWHFHAAEHLKKMREQKKSSSKVVTKGPVESEAARAASRDALFETGRSGHQNLVYSEPHPGLKHAVIADTHAHLAVEPHNIAHDAMIDQHPQARQLAAEPLDRHIDAMLGHHRTISTPTNYPVGQTHRSLHEQAIEAHRQAISSIDLTGRHLAERAQAATLAARKATRKTPGGRDRGPFGLDTHWAHADRASTQARDALASIDAGARPENVGRYHQEATVYHRRAANRHEALSDRPRSSPYHAIAARLHREARMLHQQAVQHHLTRQSTQKARKPVDVLKGLRESTAAHDASKRALGSARQHAYDWNDTDRKQPIPNLEHAAEHAEDAKHRVMASHDMTEEGHPEAGNIKNQAIHDHIQSLIHHYHAQDQANGKYLTHNEDAVNSHRIAYSDLDPEGKKLQDIAHKASEDALSKSRRYSRNHNHTYNADMALSHSRIAQNTDIPERRFRMHKWAVVYHDAATARHAARGEVAAANQHDLARFLHEQTVNHFNREGKYAW